MKEFVMSKESPIVATAQGKLRGFRFDGVDHFFGIRYAKAKRFQMPEPVAPWEGVKDAGSYGMNCPVLDEPMPTGEVMIPHRFWPSSEHCQYLNVWTDGCDPAAKKPVLFWIHGGGYSAGSSIEHVAYEGDHMSQYGDVVVVSLNHRLNILGYLDLEPFGEKYRNSCNAGNADMVAALQWIHDNIAAFGGDPDNVTLFGQSGGGMKIWTLMQTPAADGLFHKGIIQSGVIDRPPWDKPADGRQIVTALMEKLGLTEVSQLETVPYGRMAEAYNEISPALVEQGVYVGGYPTPNEFYLGDPRVVGFTEHARTIPILIGTVLGEFVFYMLGMDKYALSEEELYSMVEARYGDTAPQLIQMFKAGDKMAFDRLVTLYAPKLYRTAYGLLSSKQDAEEVVQDAFVRAFRALDNFRGDSSFETWMQRIVINLSRNKFHWNRRRGEGLMTSISETVDETGETKEIALPDERLRPDTRLENEETERNVLKGLQALPESLRETMILRHVNDMPYEKIAEQLECKVGTVKSRLARGRELLKTYLLNLDRSARP